MGDHVYSDRALAMSFAVAPLCVAQNPRLFQGISLLILLRRVLPYCFPVAVFILLFINATPTLASMSSHTIDIASFPDSCTLAAPYGRGCIHWDKDALYNGWLVSGSSPPDENITGRHETITDSHLLVIAMSSPHTPDSEENAIGNRSFAGEPDDAPAFVVDKRMLPSAAGFILFVIFGIVTSGIVVYMVRQRSMTASYLVGYIRVRTERQYRRHRRFRHYIHACNLHVLDHLGITASIIRPPKGNTASEWYFIQNAEDSRIGRYNLKATEAALDDVPPMTVLRIRIENEAERTVLMVAATPWAVQELHPTIHGRPMGEDFIQCYGQEIHMGEDRLLMRLNCNRIP